MPGLPTDEEVPAEILAAAREQSFEGQQALTSWIFQRFLITNVSRDLLSDCIAEFLELLRRGTVPDRPVGLLRSLLFSRRCDERRREKHLRKIREDLSSVPRFEPDPVVAVAEKELANIVFLAAITRTRSPVAAIAWGRANGWKFAAIAKALEEHFDEAWSEARARHVFFRLRSQLKAEFENR